MCGRFTLKTPVDNWLKDLFPDWNADQELADLSLSADLTRARYNIAPSQQIVAKQFDLVREHYHNSIQCRFDERTRQDASIDGQLDTDFCLA